MQYRTHGNGVGMDDLYCLPETARDHEVLRRVKRTLSPERCRWFSASGDWQGKRALEITFGECLREDIDRML